MQRLKPIVFTFAQGFTKFNSESDSFNFSFHVNTTSFPINHTHLDYWEFTIITKGALTNHRKNKKIYLPNRTIFISPSNEEHFLLTYKNIDTEYINIPIRESYLFSILNLFPPNFKNFLLSNRQITISDHTLNKIQTLLFSTTTHLTKNILPSHQVFTNDEFLLNIFLIVLQQFFNAYLKKPQTDNTPKWVLKLQEIFDNTDSPVFSVQELSNKLNYTRGHLTKLFLSYFNTPPAQYLFQLKMVYAKNLLINTDLSITNIADNLSYSHVSQFCKAFKQNFQCTPKEFREKYKPAQHTPPQNI